MRSSTSGLAILLAVTPALAGDRPAFAATGVAHRSETSRASMPIAELASPSSTRSPDRTRFPLHFTAPADGGHSDSSTTTRHADGAVRGYEFLQIDATGKSTLLFGYADSLGDAMLVPHSPGAHETVWLESVDIRLARTIFVLSHGWSGRESPRSNGVAIAAIVGSRVTTAQARPARIHLAVPIVAHPRERSGEAALEMVMRYYGAGPDSARRTWRPNGRVPSPADIRGLAAAARHAGYSATIATLTPDSLIALVGSRVPPILLYRASADSAETTRFGVVTGWDATRDTFTLNEGESRAHVVSREELARRWGTAGSQALVVRPARNVMAAGPVGP